MPRAPRPGPTSAPRRPPTPSRTPGCGHPPAATGAWRRCSRASTRTRELRAWWHMAQVTSERLGMSDHSWVHVQIVLNIALRILRLLGGRGSSRRWLPTTRWAGATRRSSWPRGALLHDVGHVDPPRRPRGLQPVPGRAQAEASCSAISTASRSARWSPRRRCTRSSATAVAASRTRSRQGSCELRTRSTWRRGARGCPWKPAGWGSTRCRPRRSTRSSSRRGRSGRSGSRSR